MIFDEYFDKVVVINLEKRPERLEFCTEQLHNLQLSNQFVVQKAIDGKIMTPPLWFKAGAGAWGCLQSHIRVIQDFMMDPDFKTKKLLILEDDVLFYKDANRMFRLFIEKLGSRDWGQVYLGGQHHHTPEEVEPGLFLCKSVNRTHAYAIHGSYANVILKRLMNFTDYVNSEHHVDSQLELCHRKQLWPVYSPTWWIAGQNCSKSDVNERFNRIQWWDLGDRRTIKSVPFIRIDCDDSDYSDFLYKEEVRMIIKEDGQHTDNVLNMATVAWMRRLLPAFEGNSVDVSFINTKVNGGIVLLSEVKDQLQEMIDARVVYE